MIYFRNFLVEENVSGGIIIVLSDLGREDV